MSVCARAFERTRFEQSLSAPTSLNHFDSPLVQQDPSLLAEKFLVKELCSRCHYTPRPASLKDLFRAICRDLSQTDRPCLARVDVSIHPVALAVYLSHTLTNQALIPSGSRRYHVHSHLHAQ